MTIVLSPRAEELMQDAEDAVVLGQEAEERLAHIVAEECKAREISEDERDEILSILNHELPA